MTKAKILVVDDQPANVQILAESLQTEYDVRIANNGEKALQIVHKNEKPDLILLDVMMPDLDGFEVCRRLKSHEDTRQIPVIFITAKNNALDEELGLKIGAIDYISKPFSIPVVCARVANHILLKQRADLLYELASIDPLNHLANRRQLDSMLDKEWRWAQRTDTELSVLMVDIDHFKLYNDHYGHGAGDECLKLVADTLRASLVRPRDFVARYGGEEFIGILPSTSCEGAKTTAERLRIGVENLRIPHAYSSAGPVLSISVGCATARPSLKELDARELIVRADTQLYQSKKNGRNRVM